MSLAAQRMPSHRRPVESGAAGLPWKGLGPARLGLLTATLFAAAAAGTSLAWPSARPVDPDLVRVIRFMAVMKGGFALAAFAACFWRLARPATAWRVGIYVTAPPAMAAGSIALWAAHMPGLAAAALHLGLLAVLAAALTDRDFLPDNVVRHRRG